MPNKSKSRKQSRALVKRRKHSSRRMRGGDECNAIYQRKVAAEIEHAACVLEAMAREPALCKMIGVMMIVASISGDALDEVMYGSNLKYVGPPPSGQLLLGNAPRNNKGNPILSGGNPNNDEETKRLRIRSMAALTALDKELSARQNLAGTALSFTGIGGGAVLCAYGAATLASGGVFPFVCMAAAGVTFAGKGWSNYSKISSDAKQRNFIFSVLMTLINTGSTEATTLAAISAMKESNIEDLKAQLDLAKAQMKSNEELTRIITTAVEEVAKNTITTAGKIVESGITTTGKVVESGITTTGKVLESGITTSGKVLESGITTTGTTVSAIGKSVEVLGLGLGNNVQQVVTTLAPAANTLASGISKALENTSSAVPTLATGVADVSRTLADHSKELFDATGVVVRALPSGASRLATMTEESASRFAGMIESSASRATNLSVAAVKQARSNVIGLGQQTRLDLAALGRNTLDFSAHLLRSRGGRGSTPGDPTAPPKGREGNE